jgi:putative transposase
VPRARLADEAGEQEWKSAVLPAYKRLSRRAEALIAETYLAGVNTRRVRRALQTLFAGHIGKDTSAPRGSEPGRRGKPGKSATSPATTSSG